MDGSSLDPSMCPSGAGSPANTLKTAEAHRSSYRAAREPFTSLERPGSTRWKGSALLCWVIPSGLRFRMKSDPAAQYLEALRSRLEGDQWLFSLAESLAIGGNPGWNGGRSASACENPKESLSTVYPSRAMPPTRSGRRTLSLIQWTTVRTGACRLLVRSRSIAGAVEVLPAEGQAGGAADPLY